MKNILTFESYDPIEVDIRDIFLDAKDANDELILEIKKNPIKSTEDGYIRRYDGYNFKIYTEKSIKRYSTEWFTIDEILYNVILRIYQYMRELKYKSHLRSRNIFVVNFKDRLKFNDGVDLLNRDTGMISMTFYKN